jgi:radical SAM superfamily enzyme with C-terminal helix-hairpin-helix motif
MQKESRSKCPTGRRHLRTSPAVVINALTRRTRRGEIDLCDRRKFCIGKISILWYFLFFMFRYNAPPDVNEEKLNELFASVNAFKPQTITIFTGKSERSSSGIAEFDSAEQAADALTLANHTPMDTAGMGLGNAANGGLTN